MTLGAFAAAAILLVAFVRIESASPHPITPLHLFADAGRAGSYVARLLLVAGMFGMFFFLTQFVQEVLGFSPLRAGIAFVPMTGALFAVSRLAPRLIPRFGAKPLMVAGLIPVVTGMTWLAQISPGTTYLQGILPPMLLLGIGMGLTFVPLTLASLQGVRPQDSGAAASMVNVTQQVGGALGLAILVTVFGHASRAAARQQLQDQDVKERTDGQHCQQFVAAPCRQVVPAQEVVADPVREQKLRGAIPTPFEMKILNQDVRKGLMMRIHEEQTEFRPEALGPD